MHLKIGKSGTVTIPKHIREKYGYTEGVVLYMSDWQGELKLTPAHLCSACGKPLTEESAKRGACPGCTPDNSKTYRIY